jgi:hypothetical protein
MTAFTVTRARALKYVAGAFLLLSVVLFMLSSGLIDSHAATAGISPQLLEERVQLAIPRASAEIATPQDSRGEFGQQLVVTPAHEDIERHEADAFAYGDVAWRADMLAASLATEVPGLGGYELAAPASMDVAVPTAALGLLQGSLPSPQAASKLSALGSISEKEALAQMASNLDALRSALPSLAVTSAAVDIVPVDPEKGRFALAVSVETGEGAALLKRAGDVMVGLQTGLVGDPQANIEGLSIVVEEGKGPIAASWIATRAMAGTTMVAPGLELPPVQTVDADFPDLTGGPHVSGSASGEAGQLPSLPTSARIQLTSAHRTVYSAKGRLTTPESDDHLSPRYLPHLRPRLLVEPGAEIHLGFTAPAHNVKVAFQMPSREEDHSVAVAHPVAHPASDNRLWWVVRAPGWMRLRGVTTLRITAAYPGGFGQYVAGLKGVRGKR